MSDIKKLFKHSSHYFTGHVLIMLASFISFPILTRVFSVEEYGIFGLVSVTVFILVAISKFGAQYSAVRYYNEYKIGGNEKLTTYYTTFLTQSFLFAFTVALLFLLLSKMFSKFISDPLLKDLIWIVAILSITGSLIIRLTNFIRVEQKTKLYNVIEVIRRYSRLGLGLFFVFYFSKTLKYFFSGQILIDVLVISILIYFLFLRNKINFRNFSSSLFKKSIYYGLPLLMMELATLFFRFIDRYLIQFKLTTEALGIYTVGANLSQYVQEVVFLPISLAIFPLYMEIWTNEGKEKVELFLSKTVDYLLLLCIPIVFGVCAVGKELVVFLASNKFEQAYKIIPYIITGTMIWGFYPIFAAGLYIQKKTKVLALTIFLTSCLNIVLNLILIPIWGIKGSAVSILISYVTLTIVIVNISFKYIKLDINLLNIVRYSAASIIMFLVIYNIVISNNIISIIIKSLVGTVVYLTLIMLFDHKIRELFHNILRKKL